MKFNECRINVICQYRENGKPKGCHTFTFTIDTDVWMYDEESVKVSVEEVVKGMNNSVVTFEIVDYDTIFFESQDITQMVDILYKGQFEKV